MAMSRGHTAFPGGNAGLWVCGALCTFWAFLATVGLLWPGLGVNWFGATGKPDDSLLAGFEHKRLQYELSQIVPLLLFLGIGMVFYAAGTPTRKRMREAAMEER